MKSIKKRFRIQLSGVAEVAGELLRLSEGVDLMRPVAVLAEEVLQTCQGLDRKAENLHKLEFVEQMSGDDALLHLDEVVDNDLISSLEEQFAKVLGEAPAPPIETLLQQILDKLEKKLAIMSQCIQQLGGLLNEADSF
ncbi:MAG: hypothetical protein CTY19_15275 [Methylomonas sp.]|nr:MAG: hypothetical protein CTY19_15275 [Methylomonas sp.]